MFKSGTKLQFVIYSVPCRTSAAVRKTGPALTELTCSYWAYEHNVPGKIAFHPQQVKHISLGESLTLGFSNSAHVPGQDILL